MQTVDRLYNNSFFDGKTNDADAAEFNLLTKNKEFKEDKDRID
jgi:hypothetical protein